jgi:NAD(P)-dependent dehydrogenase (short-subunit alcohol dehydrogenase family)
MKIQQKPVALVTGALGGIGQAICDVFSTKGFQVIGVDCRDAKEIRCEFVNFDIAKLHLDIKGSQSFCNRIEELAGGRIDALVNNAAAQIIKPVEKITKEDWDITLNTNLLAPFWLVQKFLPMLRAVKGSVVNIASIHALQTKSQFTVYATSKAALVALTRSLAIELAPDIRVNAVLPAATDTQMLRQSFTENREMFDKLNEFHPLGRISTPEEIAQTAFFLSGPEAGFITGAALNVDGGIGCCLHDPIN